MFPRDDDDDDAAVETRLIGRLTPSVTLSLFLSPSIPHFTLSALM